MRLDYLTGADQKLLQPSPSLASRKHSCLSPFHPVRTSYNLDVKLEDPKVPPTFIKMHGSGNETFLIWGGNGWIAGLLVVMLQNQGRIAYTTTVRMEDREGVLAELSRIRPTHVLNCAGVTGRPNVDWCEDNKEATIRSNVIGTLNLADCCAQHGVHCTIYATGCKSHAALMSVRALPFL